MKFLRLFVVLLLVAASHSVADLIPDPAAKSTGATDSQTYALYRRLVGSSWIYTWHGRKGDLTFQQGGAIETGMWPGATWRIVSPTTIAIKHPQSGEMPVRFTAEFKKFIAKDWSGDEGVGALRNPNAKVAR
jgi:hypothetical protein